MGRHRRSDAGRAAEGDDPRASAAGSDDPASAPTAPIPMGTAPYLNPEAYAAAQAKADAYLFAAGPGVPDPEPGAAGGPPSGSGAAGGSGENPGAGPGDGPGLDAGPDRGPRRQKRAGRAVSMTLLGMCVAVALGTAAVAAGVVPGFQGYRLDGSTHTTGGDRIRAAGSPSNTADAQGGTSGSADSGGTGIGGSASTGSGAGTSTGTDGSASGRGAVRSPSSAAPTPSSSPTPTKSASASPSASVSPSASPTPSKSAKPTASAPSAKPTAPRTTPAAPGTPKPKPSPTRAKPSPTPTKTAAPTPTTPPVTVSAQAAAEAEVLKLVNDERAKAGCSALSANSALTNLAESFSDDMAARGFFSDTDPDGKSPWDRATAAGVSGLGAENIARGPADPAAVVKAWMASPEHRANILNCDFHTLGVGVHFGAGGPWWTEEFGA
ncbi:CAP domain-containing protein [Streptomyces sp. CMSTAAHL-2]|uniref:CAP domain-containing protein n=1 Tax=Streptomyces sp. CMSTAAHL-2 TaxID=2904522 RepID=UPI001E42C64B|nr:CAP domain-containing protein [Streptomyces sp. CMSTAAHL-2]MCE3029163.1 CAP domain-containing protein [Streptomyces sp. CMSTAAHL-2]